jgi:pimeloyl-ACP methyl ester carboxylesterase
MSKFYYNNKEVYYEITGNGTPLLLLHGNTASSKMFSSLIDIYKKDFQLILLDYPGHGQSQRLEELSTDYWYENSKTVIELIKHLGLEKVDLMGTSGGAQVALNAALECPEVINKVIADSFEGEISFPWFAENVQKDREQAKKNEGARSFWQYNHGLDWEKVVDQDTQAIKKHHREIRRFFHKELSNLKIPVLLVGSKEDEFMGDMIATIYGDLMKKLPHATIYLFEKGGHPAIISNMTEFYRIAKGFLLS